MALKVELKPGERIILGDSVVTNDGPRTKLVIEGGAPILREKDIMRADEANTPCKRIYLAVQLMYLTGNMDEHAQTYRQLAEDVLQAAPSTSPHIARLNKLLLTGAFYKALKEARGLIGYEEELITNARSNSSLQSDGQDHTAAP